MTSFVPYFSVGVAFLLKWSLWALNFVIVFIQNLPFSVSHISFDIKQTVMIFLAIFCFSAYSFSKKFEPLIIGLASLLIACLFNLQTNYQTLTSSRMIVYAGQKNTHVSFINHNLNTVFTTDSVEVEKIAKTFWQNQKLDKPKYIQKSDWYSDGFATFEGNKVLILTNEFLNKMTTSKPIELDFLIVGNRLKPKIEQILDCVHPHNIIVDKSVSKWSTDNIRKVCKDRGIRFYAIAEQGAYELDIKD